MKRLFLLLLLFATAGAAVAQKRDYLKEYEEFKRRSLQQYDDFRNKANASYEKFMREAWTEVGVEVPEPLPVRPEPPQPVVKDPEAEPEPTSEPLPIEQVVPPVAPVVPPQPVSPIPVPERTVQPTFAFLYYGTPCKVSLEAKHRFKLAGVDENSVADGWGKLSKDEYLPIVSQALDLRSKLKLCDWGYVRLLEKMTTAFFGEAGMNEARLMQMYILTQSGYKVRIARAGNRLLLLLPSQETIYEYPYLSIKNSKYYIVDSSLQATSFSVFDREFPKERYFSLLMNDEPQLSLNPVDPRTLTSRRYEELTASVSVNKNLIDFYDDYPLNDQWNLYAKASLSADVKDQLYPVLQEKLEGLDKPTAANRLLNFVQTAFDYKIDEEQFGQERPLFADETLYYPFSDCEDRAILYSVLVRDLLGLEVVLLQYPEHLATAVYFDEELRGDYVTLGEKKFLVCDPTYIGASIGDAMPQYKRVGARIIQID